MRYFPHSSDSVGSMLSVVERKSLDDLFRSIPKTMHLQRPLNLPKPLDELELKRVLARFLQYHPFTSFLGAGATEHFVPEWISQQLMRAEWYTSYTPYQPEASQGTLQAIFEFQSMVASLFGLDVANASMYDGATALVEAILLAMRVTTKKTVLVPANVHPEYRQCVATYCRAANFIMRVIATDSTGLIDNSCLEKELKENATDLAAIVVQSPNFFGRFESISQVASLAQEHNALLISVTTDMTSLGISTPLGSLGVDIAVGEGLGLLGGLSLGGPGVGLFACKRKYLRQMPGRLVGLTKDRREKPGFVLTLSTREQHIRREKATSNICTNHNLMALAFAMTLSAYGKSGFIRLAKTNLKKTLYFRRCLQNYKITPAFLGPHYNETVIDLGDKLEKRMHAAHAKKIYAGLPLEKFYPLLSGYLLVATTELHRDSDIETLSALLAGEYDGEA